MARRPSGVSASTEMGRYVRSLVVEWTALWVARWPSAAGVERQRSAAEDECAVAESWLAAAECRVFGDQRRFDIHGNRRFRLSAANALTEINLANPEGVA